MVRGVLALVMLVVCWLEGSATGSDSVPGFNWARTHFPRVSLSAPNGQFKSYQGLRNTTAWRPKFGRGFVTISQTTTLPSTSVLYQDSTGSVGLLRKTGPVTAGLTASTYKLSLTASGNSSTNTSCQLDLQVDVLCVEVDLNLRGLGLVGGMIRVALIAYNQIRQTIASSLQDTLTTIVTEKVTNDVATRLDLYALCKILVDSNSTTWPEPLF